MAAAAAVLTTFFTISVTQEKTYTLLTFFKAETEVAVGNNKGSKCKESQILSYL